MLLVCLGWMTMLSAPARAEDAKDAKDAGSPAAPRLLCEEAYRERMGKDLLDAGTHTLGVVTLGALGVPAIVDDPTDRASILSGAGSTVAAGVGVASVTSDVAEVADLRGALRLLQDAQVGDGLALRGLVAEIAAATPDRTVSVTRAGRALLEGDAQRVFCPTGTEAVATAADLRTWVERTARTAEAR